MLLYTSNEQAENKIKKTIPLSKKQIKYLGINLNKDAKELVP